MAARSSRYGDHQHTSSHGASTLPPDYTSRAAQSESYHHKSWDPAPYDSIIYDDEYGSRSHHVSSQEIRKHAALNSASNAAGLGANTNAYKLQLPATNMGVESPSMYTDPFEPPYSSAPPPNVTSTRPGYLDSDPFAGEDRPLGGPSNLDRADTLFPQDSISSYNVRVGRNTEPDRKHEFSNDSSNKRYSYADPQFTSRNPYSSAHNEGLDERDLYHHGGGGYSHQNYDMSGTELPLKHHAGQMGYAEDEDDEANQIKRGSAALWTNQMGESHNLPEEDPKSGLLSKLAGSNRHLTDDEKLRDLIEKRRQGIGRQRWPFVTWTVAVALTIVFIIELIKAKSATGQAVQTHPQVNPMLGPSSEFLISFGARFVPCMRNVPALPTTELLPCVNASTSSSNTYTSNQLCPISEICGLKNASDPNQSYRFVSAIFLHAGFVHIFFNLLVQLTLCAQIEKLIGSIAYTLIYFAGGLGGNLLGGNFGLIGQPALGASGAIYTCISVELIDLLYNWKYEYRAKTRLTMSIVFAVLGLGLGLLPGLDNFSHIGGFCVGLLGGLLFAPSIHPTKQHRVVTWVFRLIALGLLIGFFAGLASNFYNSQDPTKACTWCRYLSCLPVFNSCKGNGLTTTTTTTTSGGN